MAFTHAHAVRSSYGRGTLPKTDRCSTKDADLASLPMWNIKFSDGLIIGAYPEEIIPREMKANGCPIDIVEQ